MREVQTHTEIGATPERVWQVLADLQAYQEWNPFIHGERFRCILVPFFGSIIRNAARGFEEMNRALKARAEQEDST